VACSARTQIIDLTVVDGVLYVLDGREVLGTRDLARWVTIATTPTRTTSIGILDGALYAGLLTPSCSGTAVPSVLLVPEAGGTVSRPQLELHRAGLGSAL